MGSVIGGVTDAIGLTDHEGADRAAAASQLAADRGYELTTDEIDFQREQYYDWKDTYGTMEEQLATYYNNYTGEDQIASQLGAASQEFQAADKSLTQSLAQRGLSGSGAEALGLTSLASQAASTKAGIRNSQDDLQEQKMLGFLGLGLGQGTEMLGINAQVANTGATTQTSLSNAQSSLYGALSTQNMKTTSDITGKIIGGAMTAGSDIRFKDNLELIKIVDGINIYSWDWNDLAKEILDYSGSAIGIIAQEVQDILPDVIVKSDGYLMVMLDMLPENIRKEVNYGK